MQPNPVVRASAALGVVVVPGGGGDHGAAADAPISRGAFPLGTISRFELQVRVTVRVRLTLRVRD